MAPPMLFNTSTCIWRGGRLVWSKAGRLHLHHHGALALACTQGWSRPLL